MGLFRIELKRITHLLMSATNQSAHYEFLVYHPFIILLNDSILILAMILVDKLDHSVVFVKPSHCMGGYTDRVGPLHLCKWQVPLGQIGLPQNSSHFWLLLSILCWKSLLRHGRKLNKRCSPCP